MGRMGRTLLLSDPLIYSPESYFTSPCSDEEFTRLLWNCIALKTLSNRHFCIACFCAWFITILINKYADKYCLFCYGQAR